MRIPAGSIVTACALVAALFVAGCAGQTVRETVPGGEIFLQPAADRGPDPFTDSTAARATAGRPSAQTAPMPPGLPQPAGQAGVGPRAVRALSGATPGLYSGTQRVSGCDVEREIGYLAADAGKGDAFARAVGISRTAIPGYLRGLAPVVLRADTRVTNHSYRHRQASGFQSVLQAGTAVLVDDRGVPRVRCACGNPLKPPEAGRGIPAARGTAWSGYRPADVVVVTPAPLAVTAVTIIDVETGTWFERRIGHDVRHDRVVPAPAWVSRQVGTEPPHTGRPSPQERRPDPSTSAGAVGGTGGAGGTGGTGGTARLPSADASPAVATATPATATPATATPGDRTGPDGSPTGPSGAATGPADPGASPPGTTAPRDPPSYVAPSTDGSVPDTPGEIGPPSVPGTPGLPDDDGVLADDTPAVRTPAVRTSAGAGSSGNVTGSIFDSPTDVLGAAERGPTSRTIM